MVARRLGMRAPTTYVVGDEVLVRLPRMKPGKRRKKQYRFIHSVRGKITDVDRTKYRYKVSLESDEAFQDQWFSVSDITSCTREEEALRHKTRSGSGKKFYSIESFSPKPTFTWLFNMNFKLIATF